MCGIAGIINFDNTPLVYDQIKAMTNSIIHRGPDGEGHYVDKIIALGHRRLAIIDLSAAGQQPMQTADGRYVITYNGEIYNFQELRVELEVLGYQFKSRTDTEVVLNAYSAWGAKCIDKFNGMFAFAIWDKKTKKLFIGRDRYGIKPFYYYKSKNHFIFGSEIKAIIASALYKTELDKEALVEYLTFQNYFTDKTLFRNVKIFPAGYYGELDLKGNLSLIQYWDFDFQESLKISEEEAIEEIDRLFKQSIQRQLVSDVPVNSYLSGGIDSGAIAMIASKYIPNMKTFTIGFDLSSANGLELAFDERAKAEHISYLAKTEHYEMVLKAGDMERCMSSLVTHLEEPRVGQSYPNYYASKLASKFGKVVLSGTGGDELFAGYPWRYFQHNEAKTFEQFLDEYYIKWQRLMPNKVLKELIFLIYNEVKHVWTKDIFSNLFKKSSKSNLTTSEEFLNHSLYLESKTFLHGLLIVEDKLSMAHSLETRIPFLDNDLVNFSMKIPVKYKLDAIPTEYQLDENQAELKRINKYKSGKKILRKALVPYMPEKITNGDKQGFSAPDASWFKGDSINYVKKILLNPKARIYDVLNNSSVEEMINLHLQGHKNNRLAIWSFLNLEVLLNRFF